MKNQLSRRDFLKLAGLLPLGMAAPRILRTLGQPPVQGGKSQNVIIIVFDAWSAYHLSMDGYARETTPNINRLAARAVRYHNHYANANFTSPGVGSLLTGVLPWTHRAFKLGGEVDARFESRSLFHAFPSHHRMTYTHNIWAQNITRQFIRDIDEFIPREELLLASLDNFIPRVFPNDEDLAGVSWTRAMKIGEEGYAYSLLFSHVNESLQKKRLEDILAQFPRGLPTSGVDSGFTLEDAHKYITSRLTDVPRPVLGYFHFLPPHFPYRTSIEFDNVFLNDDYQAIEKPRDLFAENERTNLGLKRRLYDEFILYCDREFARFYDFMETSGMLDDTWLVLTSDHGELFERGINGHSTDVLYQPLLRVPLMIFEPGRTEGMDVYDNTSAIDLLPTLTHVTGQQLPDWTEGDILPPFHPAGKLPDRTVHALRGAKNEKYAPLTVATFAMMRGDYKLIRYTGYPQTPDGLTQLYDLRSDPGEMNDLAKIKPGTVAELLNELQIKLKEVDAPYVKS